jgi:hypothetical protein
MAKPAGPKTRRMSPGRRAISRLERLKELAARVVPAKGVGGNVTAPLVEPEAAKISRRAPSDQPQLTNTGLFAGADD